MDNRGFSILETVISAALVLILTLTGFQSAIAVGRCTAAVRRTLVAVNLASTSLAVERSAGGSSSSECRAVTVGGCRFDISIRRGETADRHLRPVVVTVGWREGSRRRTHQVRTFVWRPS